MKTKTKTMNFRLSEDDYRKLSELEKQTGLEKSQILRYLINQTYSKVCEKGEEIFK